MGVDGICERSQVLGCRLRTLHLGVVPPIRQPEIWQVTRCRLITTRDLEPFGLIFPSDAQRIEEHCPAGLEARPEAAASVLGFYSLDLHSQPFEGRRSGTSPVRPRTAGDLDVVCAELAGDELRCLLDVLFGGFLQDPRGGLAGLGDALTEASEDLLAHVGGEL